MTHLFNPLYSATYRVASFFVLSVLLSLSFTVNADEHGDWPQKGWEVIDTDKGYTQLIEDLHEAVLEANMFVVTEAGPTAAAAARGETIPGNRVIGVFRNDFAVRIIRLSVPAMIEAPLRFYVTEAPSGTATLAWKTPSAVFASYAQDSDGELTEIARELDEIFVRIAELATQP